MFLSKTDLNPFFNSRAICKFYGVHVNESNAAKCAAFYLLLVNFNIRDRNRRECALRLSSFVWNAAQTTSRIGLSDRIYIRLECVSEGICTWSFQDWITVRSEKTLEVTRCK